MFRFTIRDLLWLTLVVALGLAWSIRERQLRLTTDLIGSQAEKWRLATGALEQALIDSHCQVGWDFGQSEVRVFWPAEGLAHHFDFSIYHLSGTKLE